MDLIINNKIITAPIDTILEQLRLETYNQYLPIIKRERNFNIAVSCPFHKDGQEKHPSCNIFTDRDHPTVQYGFYKCFTCGSSGPLYRLVGYCFGQNDDFGKQWLVERFGSLITTRDEILPEITLKPSHQKTQFLDESVLEQYNVYHPYLETRHISRETATKFKIGFNSKTQSITFPLWDSVGNLLGITERSVLNKHFNIPTALDKPVYLLNYVLKENITEVWVAESQFNTLTLWQWGYPAIGLLGTGSKKQFEILKRSGIRSYHLCFDGDAAGNGGIQKFKKYMPDDILIDIIKIPTGKDVNDLSLHEFENLQHVVDFI